MDISLTFVQSLNGQQSAIDADYNQYYTIIGIQKSANNYPKSSIFSCIHKLSILLHHTIHNRKSPIKI